MYLSKHVTIEEFERSETAIKHGINNTMGLTEKDASKRLCENVFEPIRAHLGKPIRINSGFRSVRVNSRIGGAISSQHCKGEAMDLDLHDRVLFEWIIDNINFDQLIFEAGTENSAGWFHISYKTPNRNRKQVLRMKKVNGKSIYTNYTRMDK